MEDNLSKKTDADAVAWILDAADRASLLALMSAEQGAAEKVDASEGRALPPCPELQALLKAHRDAVYRRQDLAHRIALKQAGVRPFACPCVDAAR